MWNKLLIYEIEAYFLNKTLHSSGTGSCCNCCQTCHIK